MKDEMKTPDFREPFITFSKRTNYTYLEQYIEGKNEKNHSIHDLVDDTDSLHGALGSGI